MLRITDELWGLIRKHFPEEHIPDDRPGRKPIPAQKVLDAVLSILNTGAQWHIPPQSYPNYKTVHRRFQQWCENEVIHAALTELAIVLREEGSIDESECHIDATFASAKGGGDDIGPTRRGKGVKIMAIVDRHGLPLAVTTHAANHHEVTLVQLTFDFFMIVPTRSARGRTVADCVGTSVAGSSSASLLGFNGNVASWFAGNTTRPISSVSCSLQPNASCLGTFEIVSRGAGVLGVPADFPGIISSGCPFV